MRTGWIALSAVAALLAGATQAGAAASVGSKAPPVEPSEWLNVTGPPLSWAKLQGRLILIEKWATW